MTSHTSTLKNKETSQAHKEQVLADYRLCCLSREASLLGRKEVLTGKAKFGIFGDGKELAQVALAKSFQDGDIRSGYYRDQTLMMAIGQCTVEQFYAQLYANPDLDQDPFSAGRQMNAHFATRFLDDQGNWKNLTTEKHSSSDTSPTASQMARAVGLALASKVYRQNPTMDEDGNFSKEGNEVVFTTIGDASTSEGIFWESLNAAGVMRIPMAMSIWDDGYGISVPRKYQTTKGSLKDILQGFAPNEEGEGIDVYTCKGWDYVGLCQMYHEGVKKMRETHRPAVFHVTEVTQPQGHSTSGSHERYKSEERLQWEEDFDCIKKFGEWIIECEIATTEELDEIRKTCKGEARSSAKNAWQAFRGKIDEEKQIALGKLKAVSAASSNSSFVDASISQLESTSHAIRKDLIATAKEVLRICRQESSEALNELRSWLHNFQGDYQRRYSSHLYSESPRSALNVEGVDPIFTDDSPTLNGFEILNKCFDANFENESKLIAFGEDVGHIGDVNQGFAGMQEKYGIERIWDTGIREATIMGQGIGLAMRGLRPIAEIQYLDYLIYGLQPLVDDLSTMQYRTMGGQKSPLIIRTRGHRLEGIWHTGSPMGMILHSLRGVYVLTPRNMTQAVGFYNTMLASDDPALIIECLNGYRLKERLPDNLVSFKVPIGKVEVLETGTDVTLLTYGSCVRIAEKAVSMLSEVGISVELIDAQSLLPFDLDHETVKSLEKTNRLVILDEDVPGGASSFLLQKVLEEQKGYYHLDAEPKTITAEAHRSAFGSDGDYFSKPNAEDVFEGIYEIMHEADPNTYPMFY